jgi:uncharacterized membrane protein
MSEVFVFMGAYMSEEDAHADYEVLKDLHRAGVVGTYDAAVVTRGADGQVHVSKDELPTRHGAWTGAAVGAVAGLLFPPSLLVSGAVGAGAGALVGHFRRGLSRDDVRELGNLLEAGEAGLVIVAESRLSEILERELKRPRMTVERGLAASPALTEELQATLTTRP